MESKERNEVMEKLIKTVNINLGIENGILKEQDISGSPIGVLNAILGLSEEIICNCILGMNHASDEEISFVKMAVVDMLQDTANNVAKLTVIKVV